ncbi:MAG: hypothetical protein ACREM1_16020 [Longimicrobiales bacterium]
MKSVERAGLTLARTLWRQIHPQAPPVATVATPVTHPRAPASQARALPVLASATGGSAKGNTQHTPHATAPAVDATAAPRAVFSRAGGFGVGLRINTASRACRCPRHELFEQRIGGEPRVLGRADRQLDFAGRFAKIERQKSAATLLATHELTDAVHRFGRET